MSYVFKRVAKNALYILTSQVFDKVVGLAFIAFSTRLLGVKAFGIFVTVNTLIVITSIFANLGIRAMVVRMISKEKSRSEELISNLLTLRSFIAILAYSFLVLFVNLCGYPDDIKVLVYIAGTILLFRALIDSFRIVFIAYEKLKVWGILIVSSSFVFSTSSIIALLLGYRIKAIFLLDIFTALGFALLSGIYVRKYIFKFRPRFNPTVAKDLLIKSLPFFAATLIVLLNQKIDIMMLSIMESTVDSYLAIGYYAPSQRILLALMILPQGINMAMLPMVSQKIYSEHEVVKKSIEKATRFVMIAMSFPIILVTTFFPGEIITILFGADYIKGAPVLTLLGWAYAFHAVNVPTNSVLGSSKELKKALPLFFGALLANILLNYLLIPKYSYIGASIATCFTMVVSFIGRFYFLRKILEFTASDIKGYLVLMVALGTTIGSVYLIRVYVEWYILAPITIVIYLFFLYIFKAIQSEEIALVTSWGRKKLKKAD